MNKNREAGKAYQVLLDFATPQLRLKPPTVAKRRTASRSRRRLLLIDYHDWLTLAESTDHLSPALVAATR
ncbi:hypothetical protein RCH10_004507 [Variovorax sp. GrIS 2.14]|uniref:hypothetical protein n=1 Tax=Variovorax sp. GrIS 2.14 TaxID=3071709 RepID=UPI0038F796B7